MCVTPVPCLLDGATGTELERAGVDLPAPLWSAHAVDAAPQMLEDLHAAYLQAGADAISTCTFGAHDRSATAAGRPGDAARLVAEAVAIARRARDRVRPDALVLGSVGPLEDCWSPAAAPDHDVCRAEHVLAMRRLLEAGVDGLLIETIGTVREAVAAAGAARAVGAPWWCLAVTVRSCGAPGILLSGEPAADAFGAAHGADMVAVNCIAAPMVEKVLRQLGPLRPAGAALGAWANTSTRLADGSWQPTDAVDPERYAAYAATWLDAGATLVGGCCGTTVEHVRAMRRLVGTRPTD